MLIQVVKSVFTGYNASEPKFNLPERRDECPFRLVACKHCIKYSQAKNLRAHEEVCDRVPILCTKNCGILAALPRSDTAAHASVCPLVCIACLFASVEKTEAV